MNIKVVGIDLAKNSFQVCVQSEDNSIASNRKVSRKKLLDYVRQLPAGTLIAVEACGGSSYWARTFRNMGYQVRILPAQHVKQYASHQKSDAKDAIAICEAAFRPELHAVEIKTLEQIDIKTLRLVRQRMVRNRTALMNEIRSIACEYGVVFPRGINSLMVGIPEVLEDDRNDLTHIARRVLRELLDDLRQLSDDVDDLTKQIVSLCQKHPYYQALLSIPGFGPLLTAAFLSELGDGSRFTNGRQVSAWVGVVPRQYGTGGTLKLGAITKHGDAGLRTLLIHGARAVVSHIGERQDPLSCWLRGLIQRRGKNKAIVALANKMARIGWRVLSSGAMYDEALAFKAA